MKSERRFVEDLYSELKKVDGEFKAVELEDMPRMNSEAVSTSLSHLITTYDEFPMERRSEESNGNTYVYRVTDEEKLDEFYEEVKERKSWEKEGKDNKEILEELKNKYDEGASIGEFELYREISSLFVSTGENDIERIGKIVDMLKECEDVVYEQEEDKYRFLE